MKKIDGLEDIFYIGVDDLTLDLFENQYKIPQGVSYNSYVIRDQKSVVMDTADERVTDQWFDNLEQALDGKAPDYLVVSHLEPDHAANIQRFMHKYPETELLISEKGKTMMPQFFDVDFADRIHAVGEGDQLKTGKHTLTFVMAPMVHWPEVMVTYDAEEQVLFSADGFGTFGALHGDLTGRRPDWAEEARRYYINIVGKYGMSVQALLKKAAALTIRAICPLHGPVLSGDLKEYLEKYQTWSSYTPEEKGTVVAYASLHGNTGKAAYALADILKARGEKTILLDLARTDVSVAVARAYQYDKIVFASVTYDGGLMPCMEDLLYHLKLKMFQNRKAAVIENGSWGPIAGKHIRDYLAGMRNVTVCEKTVTIRSALKEADYQGLEELAAQLLG